MGQTSRLDPEERRQLLVTAAEEVFADQGYTQTGLADVAARADVSKTLLYHYFPDGRPELYREVMRARTEELASVIRRVAHRPEPVGERLVQVAGALFAYFAEHPDAYRLLILEPWGAGDAGVVGEAAAARARLSGELNQLLAGAAQPLPVTLGGGAAVMGTMLHLCELWMSGQVSRQEATDVAETFIAAGLSALDLV